METKEMLDYWTEQIIISEKALEYAKTERQKILEAIIISAMEEN